MNNARSKTYSFRRILYVWLYRICDWSMFTLSEASMTKYFEKKWKIIQLFHKLAIFRWWHLTYMKHLFDAFVYTSFLTHPLDTIFMCRCSKTQKRQKIYVLNICVYWILVTVLNGLIAFEFFISKSKRTEKKFIQNQSPGGDLKKMFLIILWDLQIYKKEPPT